MKHQVYSQQKTMLTRPLIFHPLYIETDRRHFFLPDQVENLNETPARNLSSYRFVD